MTSSQQAFDGIRAKIDRARDHVEALRQDVAAFAATRPFGIAVERRAGWIAFRAKRTGQTEVPIRAILTAGEVAHQLRSALNHLAYQLVLANHQQPSRRTQFPIFCDPAEYARRAEAMTNGMNAKATDRIEGVQPFKRRTNPEHDPLWLIAELNNTDKHRVIPMTVVAIELLRTRDSEDDIVYADTSLLRVPVPLSEGMEIMRLAGDGFMSAKYVDATLTCTVAFDELGGAEHRPVVAFLEAATKYVDEVVDSFSPTFL